MRPYRCVKAETFSIVVLAGLTGFFAEAVKAQVPSNPALEARLNEKFKGSPKGPDGNLVIEEGSLLEIRKNGILGIPFGPTGIPQSTYKQDGQMHPPGPLQRTLAGQQVYTPLQAGERVYLVRMEVNLKGNSITFIIFKCDQCAGPSPSGLRAAVAFQFPKGYLATADPAQVEEFIGQAFSLYASAPVEAPAPAEPQVTTTIELGQTAEQVIAALGQPSKIAKVGTKEIYFYKDLKVTFINGKVTDVE